MLRALPGVIGLDRHGTSLTLLSADADETVRGLVTAGVAFRHLEVAGADLDAAFLALTSDGGRAATHDARPGLKEIPMLATRTAAAAALPSLAPFLAYLRLEVRRSLRNRRYLIFTVVFPVMLYVLYTAILPATANGPIDGLPWPVYFLVSMAAYGAIGASMSQAAPVATERRAGWARQLRVTPLPGIAYVAAKVVSAML